MTLVVVGKEPLDRLQRWTEGRFKGVSAWREGREGGREGGGLLGTVSIHA